MSDQDPGNQDPGNQAPQIRVTDEGQAESSVELENARSRTSSESTTPYCTDSDEEYNSREDARKMRTKLRNLTVEKLEASELEEKIISQAEFYFSDENLKKDGFLLKHVKRNKEGFVNLKLLSSFKKMRSLSKDFKVVANALRNSTKLQVNEEGTKVKRIDPLPKSLCEQVPVRFVVVSKIPNENPSMEFISDAFPDKEQLVSIRIVRAGKKYPNDLQAHFAHHPDLVNETVAVVEFESPDDASEVATLDFSKSTKYQGMALSLLELGPKQGAKKNRHSGVDSTEESDHATLSSSPPEDRSPKASKARNKEKKKQNRVRELAASGDESCSYASSSDNENTFAHFKSCHRRYQSNSQNSTPGSSPQTSPTMHRRRDHNAKDRGNSHVSPQSTPGSSRRGDATPPRGRGDSNNASPISSPVNSPWSSRRAQEQGRFGGKRNDHRLSPLARVSPHSSPEMPGKKLIVESGHSPNSSWITKRMEHIHDINDNHLSAKFNDFGLLRQPRGPDGSRGFQNHPLRNS